jgi:hypothetical protein
MTGNIQVIGFPNIVAVTHTIAVPLISMYGFSPNVCTWNDAAESAFNASAHAHAHDK